LKIKENFDKIYKQIDKKMSKEEANFKFHDADVKLIKFDKTIKFEFAKVGRIEVWS